MTTVGTDKLTFELAQDFPRLPDGETFAVVSTVATDSQDRLYVFQRTDPPVVVFDKEGNYLNAWGHGAFNSPHGMSISDDVIYMTDRDDSVAVAYTLEGRPLMVLGERGVHLRHGLRSRRGYGSPRRRAIQLSYRDGQGSVGRYLRFGWLSKQQDSQIYGRR